MKNPILYSLFFILFSFFPKSQNVYIGSGTLGTSGLVFNNFNKYSASESIYLDTEITAVNQGKNITKIGYYKTSGSSTTPVEIKIYLKTTAQTGINNSTNSLAEYPVGTAGLSGYTLVFSGALPNNSVSGLMEVNLDTPFYYSSGNLSVLVVCETYIVSGRPQYRYNSTGTPYKRSIYKSDSSKWSSVSPMKPGIDRAHIQLTFEPAALCSGTPDPGSTLSDAVSVCQGIDFILSLQNSVTGNNISYQWQSSSDGNNWTDINGATSASLARSQLQKTYYRCIVTCSGNSGISNPILVNMAGTIPFFEGFETGFTDNASVEGCWQQQSVTDSQKWTANSSLNTYNRAPRSGSWNSCLGSNNEDWLFYPVQLTGGTVYELEFYARQNNSSGAGITAAFGTAALPDSMSSIVDNVTITNGDYQKVSGFFLPPSSGTYYLGIKGTVNISSVYLSVDDIRLTAISGCTPPLNISADNITGNSAKISWDSSNPAANAGYEYHLSTGSSAPASTAAVTGSIAQGTSLDLNLLSSNTKYYIWLRTVCNGNEKSSWSGQYSFTTACGALNVPYTLNFDQVNTPVLPACTATENAAGSNTWNTYTSSGPAMYTSAPNSISLNSTTGSNNASFYTDALNLTGGITYRLSFKYAVQYSYNYKADITVAYSTAANSATSAVNIASLTNIQGTPQSSSTYTFTPYFIDFTPSSSGIYYLRFKGSNQAAIWLDDITVNISSTLSAPETTGPGPDILVYSIKDAIIVNSGENRIAGIEVVDLQGRILFRKDHIRSTRFEIPSANFGQLAVIIKVTTAKGTSVTKKIICR